ncbi:MAG TPA: hypothetical protein VMR86_13810 [Myxococcota bacterium]|nr:hypothetical protein [Myxococcota bacterium]
MYIPPRIDLSRHGTLGIVSFASPGRDAFGADITREFLATLQSAQPGTPVLELGDERAVLAQLGRETLDPDALRMLAERRHVDAVIVGALDSQRVSPKIALDAPSAWASASADLEASLRVRILDTRSGATVWSTVSRAKAQIAGLDMSPGGVSNVGTSGRQEAEQILVTRLVRNATGDFWGHWE